MGCMNAEFGPAIDSQDVRPPSATSSTSRRAPRCWRPTAAASRSRTRTTSRAASSASPTRRRATTSSATIRPTRSADGKFRKIEVKLRAPRKDVRMRARKGYYAPVDGKTRGSTKKSEAPPIPTSRRRSTPRTTRRRSRCACPRTSSTRRCSARPTPSSPRTWTSASFAFKEKNGRLVDAVEFLLVVAHRESGEFFRFDQKVDMKLLPTTRDRMLKSWLPIVRDFELGPGSYQAKIVVRDSNSRRLGTVVHEFTVPDPGSCRLVRDPQRHAAAGPRRRPRTRPTLVVRRTFPPGADALRPVRGVRRAAREGGHAEGAGGLPDAAGRTARSSRVGATEILPTSLGKLSRLVGTGLGSAPRATTSSCSTCATRSPAGPSTRRKRSRSGSGRPPPSAPLRQTLDRAGVYAEGAFDDTMSGPPHRDRGPRYESES